MQKHQLLPAQVRVNLQQAATAQGLTLSALSKALNKNPTYIHQFLHRSTPRRLQESDRALLAEKLNLTEYELGGPNPFEAQSSLDQKALSIPVFDAVAPAGDGVSLDCKLAIGTVNLPYSLLPRHTHCETRELSVIMVQGDSMSPTLRDGDQVLIDASQQSFQKEGLYVLRLASCLYVKRVLIHPSSKRLTVKSDNPLFECWTDVEPADIVIIGRVIWAGCRL